LAVIGAGVAVRGREGGREGERDSISDARMGGVEAERCSLYRKYRLADALQFFFLFSSFSLLVSFRSYTARMHVNRT
jgi:hypothetical protein